MVVPEEQLEACRGGVIAIGNFDGVHRGHQRMVDVLTTRARADGVPAVAVTFDPPPVALLRPEHAPPCLTLPHRKAQLLKQYGVDQVLIWPTSAELLRLSPRAFFYDIVLGQLRATGMVEGPNFYFGRNRTGDVEVLKDFCAQAGIWLEIVQPVLEGDGLVSSSRIRTLIAGGDLDAAVAMLGHAYRLSGEVVRGAGRGGSELGFPTANLGGLATLVPAEGVYAGFCELQGQEYEAAVNVGQNPTFGDESTKIEVHIIGWSGELYGKQFNVDLVARIREVQTFGSAERLKEQIHRDIESARRLCARHRAMT